MRLNCAAIVLAVASNIHAKPLDSKAVFELLKKGADLSAQQAEDLERKVQRKPSDVEARVELLAFYATQPKALDLAAIKAARAEHILWLIANDPKDGFGLFRVGTGVHRMHCRGDELADPEAFRKASDLWIEQWRRTPSADAIRREAIDAIQYCDPELAEKLLTESGDRAGLGRLYAIAVLGVTGDSYTTNDPAGSDSSLRQTPFAIKARRILEASTDPELVAAAAAFLLRTGAILWADGKLNWDYTELGNSLLTRAKQAGTNRTALLTLPTKLPHPGERPPATLRVGGNVMAASLLRKVQPRYPESARERGIQGSVLLTALIGLDGSILNLEPMEGPSELIPSAIEAVRQWAYKPTLLNGKPCYVVTRIDVNYTLSAR
jgi:TonB family protein